MPNHIRLLAVGKRKLKTVLLWNTVRRHASQSMRYHLLNNLYTFWQGTCTLRKFCAFLPNFEYGISTTEQYWQDWENLLVRGRWRINFCGYALGDLIDQREEEGEREREGREREREKDRERMGERCLSNLMPCRQTRLLKWDTCVRL